MSLSRLAFVLAVALLVFAPSAVATPAPSRATLELSAAGKRALKPLTLSSANLVVGKATVSSSARLELVGTLGFKSGRRSVSATALTLTVGRSSSSVTGRLGKKTVRLLTLTPTRPAQLDPAKSTATLTGARIALTRSAATALRTTLKLKRTPSTKTLGTFSVAYAPPGPELISSPAPPPVVTTPAATATPTPTVTATPTPPPDTSTERPPCDASRFTAAPAGSVDWLSCDLSGTRDLFSWTRYVFSTLPICSTQPGSIVASDGATRLLPNYAFDHRFPVASVSPDGTTIQLRGTITYAKPSLGINEAISNLKIVFLDAQRGEIFADGRSAPRGDACGTPSDTYTGEKVMDFTASRAGGYVRLVATVASGNQRLGGGQYEAGRPWGSFTFPER